MRVNRARKKSCARMNPFFAHKPLIFLAVAAVTASFSRAEETIALVPGQFTLHGRGAKQLLLVERLDNGHFIGQLTNGVALASSNPDVLEIKDGTAAAVSNG